MESAAQFHAEYLLLTAGIILTGGSILGFIARRVRVPDIVLFLLAGIVLGPQVLGLLKIPAAGRGLIPTGFAGSLPG